MVLVFILLKIIGKMNRFSSVKKRVLQVLVMFLGYGYTAVKLYNGLANLVAGFLDSLQRKYLLCSLFHIAHMQVYSEGLQSDAAF